MTQRRRIPLGIRATANLFRPMMRVAISKEWRGLDTLPERGFIAVTNHVSELDPFAVGLAVVSSGTTPHFLAKDSLFRIPVVGAALSRLQQVPVARSDRQAANQSLEVAQSALDRGGAILIYPEGTLTRDPELWPMRAKTGAARLALTTGAPLIPFVHWGVQDVLAPYAKLPKLLPRKKYILQVGEPIDISDLRSMPLTRTVLAEATQRIEAALTEGVAQLRGEQPPEHIWDRALNQRVPRNQIRARGGDEVSP
ncbi:lysophospholipid acyltransferase family protein [Nesterenkonia natronophila]|uniref:1-acyl-sn-glycerol-3-phosphate acyltransferase n=1 Tax=Nesterenkonia natronophila TaxID=2174932 RepID=A0A3A4EZ87_9MICC|nr:lysophospholipid acyltransferase family protein [Nesterenkonia natronophila]RJN31016.1 1-acyl-sn-glycerol-3-phosphate acyltransferase [Nesterenkonia natronophila]